MVNGLPGAGKTTLARDLARRMGLPLFSKDVIKETHADVLGAERAGWPQRRWNSAIGAAASETMWSLLADRRPRLRRAGPEPRGRSQDGGDLVRRPAGHRPAALRGTPSTPSDPRRPAHRRRMGALAAHRPATPGRPDL